MQSTAILSILRVFLIVLGALSVVWGVSDMFGDGQQSSAGVKKLVGGIAFASISGIILTWAIAQVGAAEAQAGIKGALLIPFMFPGFSGLLK